MIKKKILLRFPKGTVNQPIVSQLIRKYNLDFNILKAKILPDNEGIMAIEITGEEENFNNGIEYLRNKGLSFEYISSDIKRVDEKCTHCGVCVVMCPTEALRMDKESRMVIFDPEKCIACELCIAPCPTRAMIAHF